jgi:hypothetical protein
MIFLGFENGDVFSFSLNQNFKFDELNFLLNIQDEVLNISTLKNGLIIVGKNGVLFHLSRFKLKSEKLIPLQQEFKLPMEIHSLIVVEV